MRIIETTETDRVFERILDTRNKRFDNSPFIEAFSLFLQSTMTFQNKGHFKNSKNFEDIISLRKNLEAFRIDLSQIFTSVALEKNPKKNLHQEIKTLIEILFKNK